MVPAVCLLPSALLGPAVWRPVARALGERGWDVVETPMAPAAPRTPDAQLARYLDALPADRLLVVVAHSNAGLYIPAIAVERQIVAMVFVDAGVPPSAGPYDMAPPQLVSLLRELADPDGLLPVWTSWWGDEVSDLFPSAEVRTEVETEQKRLALPYFEGSLTAPAGWDQRPGGYVAFGDTYDAERTEAVARGWTVTTLNGRHLHLLVDPELVADTLDTLLRHLIPTLG